MTEIVCVFLVAPMLMCHLRRLIVAPPLHFIDSERSAYRNLSIFTIGVMLASAVVATASPLMWAITAFLTGALGLRIGSRLHVARPLIAKISCVPELLADDNDVDDDGTAVLRCASGGVHEVPEPVAVLMAPRSMSRTALHALPYTLVGGIHETYIGDAKDFLRDALSCGCLTFVEPADEADSETVTLDEPSTGGVS